MGCCQQCSNQADKTNNEQINSTSEKRIQTQEMIQNQNQYISENQIQFSEKENNQEQKSLIQQFQMNEKITNSLNSLSKTVDFDFQRGMIKQNTDQNIQDVYDFGKTIGEGGFGKVCLAKHKSTGIQRTIKIINKNKIKSKGEEQLFQELNILKQIDHPNILKVFEHYKDQQNHYLVSEYLSGGELFEKLKIFNNFSEQMASIYMKQILSAISYCHLNGIVHRDLKPQNIIFESKDSNSELKIIDFGASTKLTKDQKLTLGLGTLYYISPEILLKKPYDEKCDIWSLGIILYILLCGYPPFFDKSEKRTLKKIQIGKYKFDSQDWANISPEAKDLIKKMLKYNPSERISAIEACTHPWLSQNIQNQPLNKQIIKKISYFNASNKLKLAIIQIIANQLTNNQDEQEIRKHFKNLDLDSDGMITQEELLEGLTSYYNDPIKAKQIVNTIFKKIDLDKSGKVEFSEFMIASAKNEHLVCKEKIEQAFKLIDQNNDGYITKQEMEIVFGGIEINKKVWTKLLHDIDKNKDGNIQLEEFYELLLNTIDKEFLEIE